MRPNTKRIIVGIVLLAVGLVPVWSFINFCTSKENDTGWADPAVRAAFFCQYGTYIFSVALYHITYLYLKYKVIPRKNDRRVMLKRTQESQWLAEWRQHDQDDYASEYKEKTVCDYDKAAVDSRVASLYVGMYFQLSLVHLVSGLVWPDKGMGYYLFYMTCLWVFAITRLAYFLDDYLVMLHLFGFEEKGDLVRPFESPVHTGPKTLAKAEDDFNFWPFSKLKKASAQNEASTDEESIPMLQQSDDENNIRKRNGDAADRV